jgi:metal-sulfur cluster biosynthetic enzyme
VRDRWGGPCAPPRHARYEILALPGVGDATVDIVWDPPWNPQMISPEGKERLGMA